MSFPEILDRFETATGSLLHLLSSFDEQQINQVPYEGSWTAAQLSEHLRLSDATILRALNGPSAPSERSAEAKAGELEHFFLDFSSKFDAPDITVPGQGPFERKFILSSMEDSRSRIRKAAQDLDLSLVSFHPILEGMTRVELIHFVVYHTERHFNQLQRIHKAVASLSV